MRSNWESVNENQYRLAAKYYDAAFESRPDNGFYSTMASQIGGPVLEAGCGTGRILIPIAESGIEIVGFDVSESRLEICRSKLKKASQSAITVSTIHQLNMVNFKLDQKFQLAIIPFRGFQHILDCAYQLEALRSFAEHLVTGGFLIFDIYNPSIPMLADTSVFDEFQVTPEIQMFDGKILQVWEKVVDRNYNEQRIDAQEIYKITYPDNKIDEIILNYSVRYTFRFEIEHLLRISGFKIREIFSDFDATPFGEKYPGDLVIVAQKQ